MRGTEFLFNESLWRAIRIEVNSARHVEAAIAYFGTDGAKLLPLKCGDRILVNMSKANVKAGITCPAEIEKLVKRGVRAFTRDSLHAKVIVTDTSVISGSANISQNSAQRLDEAGIKTSDTEVRRQALSFIDKMCTEPVTPAYIDECKTIYRPPKFTPGKPDRSTQEEQGAHPKLWIVRLIESPLPETEERLFRTEEAKAEKLMTAPEEYAREHFHWYKKPKMADILVFGDRIIRVFVDKERDVISVHPPALFLRQSHRKRPDGSGKERWMFYVEAPKEARLMNWSRFSRVLKSKLGERSSDKPKTMPIHDDAVADHLLSLWTGSSSQR